MLLFAIVTAVTLLTATHCCRRKNRGAFHEQATRVTPVPTRS